MQRHVPNYVEQEHEKTDMQEMGTISWSQCTVPRAKRAEKQKWTFSGKATEGVIDSYRSTAHAPPTGKKNQNKQVATTFRQCRRYHNLLAEPP